MICVLLGVTTEPLIYVAELLISFITQTRVIMEHMFQRKLNSYDSANVIKE